MSTFKNPDLPSADAQPGKMAMPKVNPDLQTERDSATFTVEELTRLMNGGKDMLDRKRELEQKALLTPDFSNPLDQYHMSREERHNDVIRRMAAYIREAKKENIKDRADDYFYKRIAFPFDALPLGLHTGMFLPTLQSQCTDEQKEKWLKKAQNYEYIGTYAQTELGHGTHIRGLETTATYDPKTHEFVIHSPTRTSLKWWPGGLGKTSNVVVLMARLITKGQDHGLMPFFVQIRDMQTHEPLPGVTVGDIGPKLGYESMDNGFLGFDHFRIPRENMLMRYAEVKPDGTFERKTTNQRLSYGTMVFVRAMLVMDMGGTSLGAAATIATRYSAVRRQSELEPGAKEPQILDYQTQQFKLFPQIATAYACMFAGRNMARMYFMVQEEISSGNTERLPELHALSSGLKAFSTYAAMWGVEQCRLACGGLGYSLASGFPKIYKVTTPGATFEGENTVMYLQCARYLMKAYTQASTSKQLAESVAYLTEENNAKCQITKECSLPALVAAFKFRAVKCVEEASVKLEELRRQGLPQHEAWNNTSVQLCKAAQAHCHYHLVRTFVETVTSLDMLGISKPVQDVLHNLCQFYAVYSISQASGDFLQDGYMSSEQFRIVQSKMLELLAVLRPNAVSLVDAFDFRDHTLCSILGRYDGNVYENMYKWAQKSKLNKTQVHESYEQYLKPLKQALSKL